jgi:hypothetical protein
LAQSWRDWVLIRFRRSDHPDGMATLARKIEAEKRMRDLLEESGLPEPDHVEYGFTCIRLFFNPAKLVVVIDLDEREDAGEAADADPA